MNEKISQKVKKRFTLIAALTYKAHFIQTRHTLNKTQQYGVHDLIG